MLQVIDIQFPIFLDPIPDYYFCAIDEGSGKFFLTYFLPQGAAQTDRYPLPQGWRVLFNPDHKIFLFRDSITCHCQPACPTTPAGTPRPPVPGSQAQPKPLFSSEDLRSSPVMPEDEPKKVIFPDRKQHREIRQARCSSSHDLASRRASIEALEQSQIEQAMRESLHEASVGTTLTRPGLALRLVPHLLGD